jgi:hypothetical protein
VEARLAVSEEGLVIGTSERRGTHTELIWPAGYEARHDANGRVEIVRPDGQVVLREGDWFRCGGAVAPATGQVIDSSAVGAFLMMGEPFPVERA